MYVPLLRGVGRPALPTAMGAPRPRGRDSRAAADRALRDGLCVVGLYTLNSVDP
jgi:hypothetical protein